MIFEFVKIGRPKDQFSDLVTVYQKRLERQIRFDTRVIKAQSGENRTFEKGLIGQKHPNDHVVVLDERGTMIQSQLIANRVEGWKNSSLTKRVVFIVGGPTGISPELRRTADDVWSLSGCVLPSDLAWLILWEQIYRAQTILNGSPYHNE